jgi:DNA processing protein
MALLCDATVIIEASDKSGTLYQGRECLRLGRRLFITKSVAENSSLSWPKQMIHLGARVLSDDTVMEFLDSIPKRLPAIRAVLDPF